ncbi:hypothetical protein HD806DRAFT_500495 [Xylariaceae sp. AK1471]|nr:hypothetical protein HD806DRAFT_500495 [Xylariaceae sp. AK1471]
MRTIHILSAAFAASIVPFTSASDPANSRSNTLFQPPPGPVQPGAPVDSCYEWLETDPGLTCLDVVKSLDITVDQLKEMNPQLKGNCQKNFWSSYNYCISNDKIRSPKFITGVIH